MPLITQGKFNLKYILIVLILTVIAGGGILAYQYWWLATKEPQKPEVEDIYKCENDEDCISVSDGCCSCSMGGKATAINKNYLNYWNEKIAEECKEQVCLAVISDHWTCFAQPKCTESKCQLVETEPGEWQTYRNEQYGFEIEYPPDYFVSAITNEATFAHKKWKDQIMNHPYVSITVFETEYPVDEWVKQEIEERREEGFGEYGDESCQMHCISATAEEIRIGNNIRALRYKWWGVSGGGTYIVAGKGNSSNRLFIIYSHIAGGRDPGERSVPEDILDEMLSTFKFIELKEAEDKTADWKTYRNPAEDITDPEFEKYFKLIIEANPRLKFTKQEQRPITGGETLFPHPPSDKEDPVWIFSPARTKAVSIFGYFGEPDVRLDVYNRNNDEKVENLKLCGTPCNYWIVFWLDDTRFVFIQTVRNDYVYLSIHLYDLVENSQVIYTSQKLELTDWLTEPQWPLEWQEKWMKFCNSKYDEKTCEHLYGL